MANDADNDNVASKDIAMDASGWPYMSHGNAAIATEMVPVQPAGRPSDGAVSESPDQQLTAPKHEQQPQPAPAETELRRDDGEARELPPPVPPVGEPPVSEQPPAVPSVAENLPSVRAATAPLVVIYGYAVSSALALDELGLSFPERPMPAPQGVNVKLRTGGPARYWTQQASCMSTGSADAASAAGQSSSSLRARHTQPGPAQFGAEQSPAQSSAAAPNAGANRSPQSNTWAAKKPLTAQPGFVFGLVTAALMGAVLYLSLV